jgi:WD40 repeat protein
VPGAYDLAVAKRSRRADRRISAEDRENALVQLAGALTDGRIDADAYATAEERLHQAVTYPELEEVVGNLDASASLAERDQAVARIEGAAADGLLTPEEQHDRVAAVRRATTDAQLAALVADLPTGSGTPSQRASNADREAAAARLQDAVEAGLLDVTEFDERVRAVYAARLRDELTRLLADLPAPTNPTPAPANPTPPVAGARPAMPDQLGGAKAFVLAHSIAGTATFGTGAIALAAQGFVVLPVVLGAVWLILLLVFVTRARRAAAAAVGSSPQAKRLSRLVGHKRSVRALTCLVLPDGTALAISGAEDNTAMVWDLTKLAPLRTLTGHTNNVVAVAAMVLPDGVPVAVTAGEDNTAVVWDLRDGSPRGTLQDRKRDGIWSVACLTMPDGTPVALVLGYEALQVWDLRNLESLRRFDSGGAERVVPVVLPDGEPVAVLMESHLGNNIDIVSLKTGKRRSRLSGHTNRIEAIDATVLPDGTPVAVSVCVEKTVRVWDLEQGTSLRTITGLLSWKRAVVCTTMPDGTPIAVTTDYDDDAQVWNLLDGSVVCTVPLSGTPIAGVALPDRTLLLGWGFDDTIAVYSLS